MTFCFPLSFLLAILFVQKKKKRKKKKEKKKKNGSFKMLKWQWISNLLFGRRNSAKIPFVVTSRSLPPPFCFGLLFTFSTWSLCLPRSPNQSEKSLRLLVLQRDRLRGLSLKKAKRFCTKSNQPKIGLEKRQKTLWRKGEKEKRRNGETKVSK